MVVLRLAGCACLPSQAHWLALSEDFHVPGTVPAPDRCSHWVITATLRGRFHCIPCLQVETEARSSVPVPVQDESVQLGCSFSVCALARHTSRFRAETILVVSAMCDRPGQTPVHVSPSRRHQLPARALFPHHL